jgi:hypothetical protein
MISNTTPAAAPTNVVNSEQPQTIFFGPTSQSNTSARFTVDQNPFFIAAFNLATGDSIAIQQVFVGPPEYATPFAPVFGPVVLNTNRTTCRIDYPGVYQLVHTGPSSLGSFTVSGAAMVMSHEALTDLSEALYQVNSNLLPVDIVGTAPITVTGNGSISTPYDVAVSGINAATGAGHVLNTADAGKLPFLYTDGALHTSLLGWVSYNNGTQTDSANIDWTKGRAQTITNGSSNLMDLNLGYVLPPSPCLCFLNYIQGSSPGPLQFTGIAPVNAAGNIQPSNVAHSETLYIFWYDGTLLWLVDYTSNDGIVGRFTGGAAVQSNTTRGGGGGGNYLDDTNVVRPLADLNVYYGLPVYLGTVSGTNTYTAMLPDNILAITSYPKTLYVCKFTNANTGASTLNLSSLGAVNIYKDGAALSSGAIAANSTWLLNYNGTQFDMVGV